MAKRSSVPGIEPGFSGFPREGFEFLRSLRQNDDENNSKAWFDEHRHIYKQALRHEEICFGNQSIMGLWQCSLRSPGRQRSNGPINSAK